MSQEGNKEVEILTGSISIGNQKSMPALQIIVGPDLLLMNWQPLALSMSAFVVIRTAWVILVITKDALMQVLSCLNANNFIWSQSIDAKIKWR